MTTLTPLAMVIDRPTAPKAKAAIKALGGAWREMFRAWRGSGTAYVVLIAHTPERLRKRAPLALMLADDEKLRAALKLCCSYLSDVDCRWVLCLAPGSEAESIVREEVLRDSVAAGRA